MPKKAQNKDIEKEELEERMEEEKKGVYFSRILMALFLALLAITMAIPFYAIKLDPEPKNILSINQLGVNFTFTNQTHKASSYSDFLLFVKPEDPKIKQVSAKISTSACTDVSRICYAKALFYFVRDKIKYINDPTTLDYIEYPQDTLYSRAADCDGKAVLLANMLQSIGIQTRFVFIPGHVYLQAFLPEAMKHYKEKNSDAINLDAACQDCKFGEITPEVRKAKKTYVG